MPPRPLIKDFLYVYLLVVALRTVPRLKRKSDAWTNIDVLMHQIKSCKISREVLLLVMLPRTFRILRRRCPTSVAPAVVLSSPLLQLLDHSLRRTVAVYVATAAALNLGQGTRTRERLPPAWTLILLANSWLLWAFLFQPDCFPKGYGDLIVRHSGYGSSTLSTEQLVEFLNHTKFETVSPTALSPENSEALGNSPADIHPNHTRAVCARLHPTTPNCLETYIRAWVNQFPLVWKWVGGFGALALLLRRRKVFESPHKAFRDWLISTTRGTVFVVGTINTCWGLTCLFQRILSPGTLPHLRWIANGLLGNLWILVLPDKRRIDFSLYCTRLAVLSCWDLVGWCPMLGETILFGISWASLLRDRRNGQGPRGLGGLVLDYVDGRMTNQSDVQGSARA